MNAADVKTTVPNSNDRGLVVRILAGGVDALPAPTSATKSSVAAAVADTQLLATNPSRYGATIYNDGAANLYLSLGTVAASTSSFTIKMGPNSYYEVPSGFRGEIRGIWDVATGNARITELT